MTDTGKIARVAAHNVTGYSAPARTELAIVGVAALVAIILAGAVLFAAGKESEATALRRALDRCVTDEERGGVAPSPARAP